MEAESVCPATVMLPPKNCIPRNYSCIAGLFGSLATTQKMDDGEDEKADEEEVEGKLAVNGEYEPQDLRVVDERPRGRESFLKLPPQSPTQRRRCKSLPSPAERARLEIARSRSPNSHKKVRFADSLGLELTSVKHFDEADEPEIPERVMDKFRKARALHLNNFHQFEAPGGATQSVFMELLFSNPVASPDFPERVRKLRVSLERVNADEFCLSGLVRVLNVAFEKSVALRYTLNDWAAFVDSPASYVPHSNDGQTDKFSFKIVVPTLLEAGGTLQFAVRYLVDGQEFWDNNSGDNYRVRRHRFKISPPREWENGWIHFI